ncbi:heparinase II/III domain-containing protein [Halosimplex halobium]|uniref:heparinase II/III domain-containing protein n=1 Tax=Halosimplex halobium TaxID=3396618 RepID=UPI003F54D5EB
MPEDPSSAPLLPDMSDFSLYYHTAKNMQLPQLLGVAERKVRHRVVPLLPIDFDRRYEAKTPSQFQHCLSPIQQNLSALQAAILPQTREEYRTAAVRATDGTLEFMNHPIEIGDTFHIDWESDRLSELPLFWRFKLQGFTFLRSIYLGYDSPADCPDAVVETANNWLDDWDNYATIGSPNYLRRNWIPHSVSLRLLHLCRYLAWLDDSIDRTAKEQLLQILYKNAVFLSNHVEYDVGGNHLIENGFGLVFAGIVLGPDGDELLSQGRSVLQAESKQFLEDGGHFERSPMYHIQCLTRYLSAYDILSRVESVDLPDEIEITAHNATKYLRSICPPDRMIPLLNDSVFDEALSLEACLSYADAVGIDTDRQNSVLDSSGYYWLGSGTDRMLIDGGPVGPAHLPAHSHNDLLSYLLWIDGHRVVTDTGTYAYAPTERRTRSRSVTAHNTVQVDESEPIAIGGQYLMGRRTKPVTQFNSDTNAFDGYYQGGQSSGSYGHRRQIRHGSSWWFVLDSVKDVSGAGSIRSNIHFHPTIDLKLKEGICIASSTEMASDLHIRPFQATCELDSAPYYPEFGKEVSRSALRVFPSNEKYRFGYLLTKGNRSDIDVATTENQITIEVGD